MNENRSRAGLSASSVRAPLERALAAYLPQRRFFRSKTRTVERASLVHLLPLPAGEVELLLGVARVFFAPALAGGAEDHEDYALLLAAVDGPAADAFARTRPQAVVATLDARDSERRRVLVDALADERALRALLAFVADAAVVQADGCSVRVRRIGAPIDAGAHPRPVDAEQSNSSVVCGDVILKVMRKLDLGRSPELEMGEFLTGAGFRHTPPLRATIELARSSGEPTTLATAHTFVPNEGDAWRFALAAIGRSWAQPSRPPGSSGLGATATGFAANGLAGRAAQATAESGAAFVAALAERVAGMHVALASPAAQADARFAPEPIGRTERAALGQAVLDSLSRAFSLAEQRQDGLSAEAQDLFRRARGREARVRACVARYVDAGEGAWKTRVHGDLHLGQVIVAGGDFLIVDFEGEPARPLAERKAKRSPMVDVAGMLRSLHYASVAAWRGAPAEPRARPLSEAWHAAAHRGFVRAYLASAPERALSPAAAAARGRAPAGDGDLLAAPPLLQFHLLEKCVYELHYEMNNRPDWVAIPLIGLERILEDTDAP